MLDFDTKQWNSKEQLGSAMSHLDYDQGTSIYRMIDKGIELVASWLVVEYHQCKQGQIAYLYK